MTTAYPSPLIAGFNPDPSVVRVGADLAWDEDGNALVTYAGLRTTGPEAGAHRGIEQVRVDLDKSVTLEEPRPLWSGTGLKWPEAPHLYRRGAYWYLMVLLGVRPYGPAQLAPLGRETFVTHVDWVDGWPVAAPVELRPRPGGTAYRTGFDGPLDPGWLAVRREAAEFASTGARPGSLVITADGSTLGDPRPTFAGRRPTEPTVTVSAPVDASAGTGGIAVRYDETHYYSIDATGGHVVARAVLSGIAQTWTADLPPGPVTLTLRSTEDEVILSAADITLATIDGRYLSAEAAGSYTGRVIGLYATAGTVAFTAVTYR